MPILADLIGKVELVEISPNTQTTIDLLEQLIPGDWFKAKKIDVRGKKGKK